MVATSNSIMVLLPVSPSFITGTSEISLPVNQKWQNIVHVKPSIKNASTDLDVLVYLFCRT